MKKKLFLLSILGLASASFAQTGQYWSANESHKGKIVTDKAVSRVTFPKEFKLYQLSHQDLRNELFSVINSSRGKHSTIISLPNVEGRMEQFEVFEASNFEPELQAKYPEIRAFSGKGITDKYATLKLSISPQGIQTMVFRTDKENEFIEPYSQDHTIYAVFKSNREKGKLAWTCSTDDQKSATDIHNKIPETAKSSTGQLKTMRLAQSCTGEYANYFGATSSAQVSSVLAAFNATLTRCNGVYERDLGLHLNLISQTTNVIFYNPSTDPYSVASVGTASANANNANGWNIQLQNTLNTTLTGPSTTLAANNAVYDIGHLFGASGGGGNAGCIGCVCSNPTANGQKSKGSGFTSPGDAIPQGDNFDIDYVVHEVGHQLGGNHTFSMSNEGSGVNMEVGSGVTIMGYAGITNQDVASHSIDKYHAASIAQIQANLASKSCPVTTNISANNATPIVNAGLDYTIPKSTPFKLTGSATDANAGDALTYSWEQYDDDVDAQIDAASAASPTKLTGPNWRSYDATSSSYRYFPQLSTTLKNSQTTQGNEIAVEALSSVARTLNFRLTVRDNSPYSSTAPIKVGQTNFDDMIVSVDDTVGPFDVTSQNTTNQSWLQGSTQTITWAVNGTNLAYAANVPGDQFVDILLSTDGGLTFPTVLLSNTPNDGSQAITVPNVTTTNARIMVKAHSHIFYDINPLPIAIGYTVTSTCNTYTNNTALAVPDGTGTNLPGAVATKTISVPAPVSTISDVNVTLGFTHTYIEDLVVAVNHPDGTQVPLWARNCDNEFSTVLFTFSDGNPTIPSTGCTASSGTFAPAGSLSNFNGKPNNGTWTLLAADYFNGDTGTINNWSIEICSQTFTLANEEFEFQNFNLYPNPNNGSFTIKLASEANDVKILVNDIRGRQVFEKTFTNEGIFDQTINLNNVQAGVYLVTATDGIKKTVRRIIIE